jgi:putative ABC transport system ATP-binding protein
MSFLRLENLSKAYLEGGRRRPVLQHATVAFAKGEFTAILGKSGSGKTTLLNLVSGIDLVDDGQIYIDGIHLTALNDLQRTLFRRQNIGFIFQFFNLIPTLTVWENLILPLQLNGLDDQHHQERARALLDEVGLLDRQRTFPDRLSGGEQQRVAIARALVHDPLLVLADEPTGNLDEDTGRNIMTLLDRLTRQAGKNLILFTHSSESARYADRVLLLREGHLVPGEAHEAIG